MIVLDTNQLEHAQPPDGPLAAMLQTLAEQAGHELALPEIVLEEHLAHYRRDVEDAEARRRAAVSDLRNRLGRWVSEDRPPSLDQAVMHRMHRLQLMFRIIRTPDGAARESLLREARRQLPAKTSLEGAGAGARDVAIWLTAISACRDSGKATYFVSADNAAFGKGKLKPELSAEVAAHLGDRARDFHYCHGMDALLGEFAIKLPEVPAGEGIAAAAPVREAVSAVLDGPDVFAELALAAGLRGGIVTTRLAAESLEPAGAPRQAVAYEVDGTIWMCARLTWNAVKNMSYAPAQDLAGPMRDASVSFTIATTIMMQMAGDDVVAAEVTGYGHASRVAGRITS